MDTTTDTTTATALDAGSKYLTTEIAITDCRASPNARHVLPGQVLTLAESIKEVGLLHPITVRRGVLGFEVIAGGHRLQAVMTLGWSTIPAFVRADTDLQAELTLIDENLIRNEFSPAERAIAVSRRKAIYLALHPKTANGGDRKSDRKVCELKTSPKTERFSKATARATGSSERIVQLEAHRGAVLGVGDLARVVGTALDTGAQIDALAKLTPERRASLIDKAVAGEAPNAVRAVKAEQREGKEASLAHKTRALPEQKFNVIYADPPWRLEPYDRDSGMDRAPENHYPTMPLSMILDFAVPSIADDDCVLWLWATMTMLPQALQVMAAWGFSYESHYVWNKDRIGTGHWNRNKHELLLIGVKGEIPAPLPGAQFHSVIDAPVKDHSRKPIIFRTMIEALFPNLPKIELFARTPAPGWGQWGEEALAAALEDGLNGQPVKPTTREDRLLAAHSEDAAANP